MGRDHADVAVTCLNMGSLHYETNEHAKALELLGRALAIDERTHGTACPHARTLERGARGCNREHAVATGPEHPAVATALFNIARVYIAQGRAAEARCVRVFAVCG
jgi:hypothetical protein